MLASKPGERILDLGCGDGVLTTEIKATGADVLGVDLSDELLAVARMQASSWAVATNSSAVWACSMSPGPQITVGQPASNKA